MLLPGMKSVLSDEQRNFPSVKSQDMTIPMQNPANEQPASDDVDQSEAATRSHIHHGLPTYPVIKIISDPRTKPS